MVEVIAMDNSYIQDQYSWSGRHTLNSYHKTESATITSTRDERLNILWSSVRALDEATRCERESQVQQWILRATRRVTAMIAIEDQAADARFARLQDLARHSQEDLTAQWSVFWRSEAERGRLAAVAGEIASLR